VHPKKNDEGTEAVVKIEKPGQEAPMMGPEEMKQEEPIDGEENEPDYDDSADEDDEDEDDDEEEDEEDEDIPASRPSRPKPNSLIPSDRKLTREEFQEQTMRLLEEFVETEDTDEAISCVRDLHSPEFHSLVIELALIMVMERDDRTRRLIPKLLAAFRKEPDFSTLDYGHVFRNLVEAIPDIVLDSPKACMHIGVCIGQGLAHEYIPQDLFAKSELLEPLVNSGQAERILTAIFETIIKEKDVSTSRNVYARSSLDFARFLKSNAATQDPIARKQNFSKFLETNPNLAPVFD